MKTLIWFDGVGWPGLHRSGNVYGRGRITPDAGLAATDKTESGDVRSFNSYGRAPGSHCLLLQCISDMFEAFVVKGQVPF
jgi:hypothetical protein